MSKVTPLEKIELKLEDLRREFMIPADMEDYRLFIVLCEKYFYSDVSDRFDYEEAKDHIVDGAKDGGIDSILNDEEGNLIVIQSKFYRKTKLKKECIFVDIEKIVSTINSIENQRSDSVRDEVVQAYLNARQNMLDDSTVNIVYFTSYNASIGERKKIDASISQRYPDHNIEIKYATDVVDKIDGVDNAKEFVDYGELEIDDGKNKLQYKDAIIVNVSAKSLWTLYKKNQNGLLGMNLRYYVKSATVDRGIKDTIEQQPDSFWYRNNGITIACDAWDIDGSKLKLSNFSIINGGQTTNRIAQYGVEEDFYILCKVIKALGDTREQQEQFIVKIAEASNSQKPIKKEDLRANATEQHRLKEELKRVRVNYITKRGSKKNKLYEQPYNEVTIKRFGKLCISAKLKLPGTARNKGDAMFSPANYDLIYRNVNAPVVADLLRIDYYAEQFIKAVRKDKEYDAIFKKVVGLSQTHIVACTAFLCEMCKGVIQPNEISDLLENPEELKSFFRKKKNNLSRLLENRCSADEEKNAFYRLFDLICTNIIVDAFDNEHRLKKALDPSNFFKSDEPFLGMMITKMHRDFCSKYSKSPLRLAVECVCGVGVLESC